MAQNYNQQPANDSSGMGVVLGILLAVVVAIGAYFFIANRDGTSALEPAAGNETTVNVAPGDADTGAGMDAGAGADTGAAPATPAQ